MATGSGLAVLRERMRKRKEEVHTRPFGIRVRSLGLARGLSGGGGGGVGEPREGAVCRPPPRAGQRARGVTDATDLPAVAQSSYLSSSYEPYEGY
jgi:hypothetical protein